MNLILAVVMSGANWLLERNFQLNTNNSVHELLDTIWREKVVFLH